jgi:hypothetical protein
MSQGNIQGWLQLVEEDPLFQLDSGGICCSDIYLFSLACLYYYIFHVSALLVLSFRAILCSIC